MKYDSVQLGEISEAIRGVTFSGDETSRVAFDNSLACLTTSGVQDIVNWDSRRFIPRNCLANSKQLLQEGDILISTANSKELVGKSCIVDRLPYEVTFGAFVTVLRPNKKVIPEYLSFWMRTKEYLDRCFLMSSNTTNISNLRTSELLEFQIPLPPLTEQKRIASLLARADRLRQLRRTAHDLGDALLQSVFLEMFGDLAVNQKHWDLLFLEDIADVHGGIQVTSTRNSMKLQKPYLRVANVYRNQLDLSEIKMIGLTPSEFERTKLKKDDLLFVEGHGNINEIGRAAVWDGSIEDCVHQNHLICARLDLKLANPIFVSTYVNSPAGKSYFKNISNTTSGLNTISTNIVKSCPIPLPPLSLQEEFAGVVARVESLRGRMGESERQVEGLFESLLAEAFA